MFSFFSAMGAFEFHFILENVGVDSLSLASQPFHLVFVVRRFGTDYLYDFSGEDVSLVLCIAHALFDVSDFVSDSKCLFFNGHSFALFRNSLA